MTEATEEELQAAMDSLRGSQTAGELRVLLGKLYKELGISAK